MRKGVSGRGKRKKWIAEMEYCEEMDVTVGKYF